MRTGSAGLPRSLRKTCGSFVLTGLNGRGPRQNQAWEAVKKSTGSHGAHFPGDQKCIPHPRGLLCGRLIAKIFRPVAGVFATADFFTASGPALHKRPDTKSDGRIQNNHRKSRNSRTSCAAFRLAGIGFDCCVRSNHSRMVGRSAARSNSLLMKSERLMPSRAARAFRVLCTGSGTSLTCIIFDML